MSSIQGRLEFWRRVASSTDRLSSELHLSDSHVGPLEPTNVSLPSLEISSIPIDITSEFLNMGVAPSLIPQLNQELQGLIGPLHSAATASLTQAAASVGRKAVSEGRDAQNLLRHLQAAAQRTYELQLIEIKNIVIEETCARVSGDHVSTMIRESSHANDDDEEGSFSGGARNDDPDSDSEEAVNIERYYPVLEEMFLKGVVRPSRDEKLRLSEHTGIPYYNIGIWFQNRRDRGPHAGKGEWMRKYTESRSITPASHVSATDEAETDDSMSDHGMSEFDEDEWETDPEDVPDLNLLELGPSPPHVPAFPTIHSMSSSSRQSHSMPDASDLDAPSTPFASASRSISFESSSDCFSYSDVSFASAGTSVYAGSPSPLLEPGALLPSLISRALVPSESQIHESSLTFGQLATPPTPSTSFSSSISPSFSFSSPLARFGGTPQMRSSTPSTGPSTPDEGPSTPPTSSFGFDFGLIVPFRNSSRPNIPPPNLGLSPSINDASPSQGALQTPPTAFRSFNFEFSLTPSPTQGKFNDVDLSFGSFDIAPYSSAASFLDSFNTNSETPSSSDSASDHASPDPQQSDPPSSAVSPPPRSILLDFAGVNENHWRPGPTPEPSEVGSQGDAVESKLIAAAALVVSGCPDQLAHNHTPFKLALHHTISRPDSPLMEPLFPLSSPLRDPSPIPSPTSPVMGMLPFLNHALRPPTRVDELATYANLRAEKSPLPVPLTAECEDLDEPSPLALTQHRELEHEPTPQLSLFDVLKEPPVPVVDKATRDRVNDFFKRYCVGHNESSDGSQAKPPSFPLTSHLPASSTSTTAPQDIEGI